MRPTGCRPLPQGDQAAFRAAIDGLTSAISTVDFNLAMAYATDPGKADPRALCGLSLRLSQLDTDTARMLRVAEDKAMSKIVTATIRISITPTNTAVLPPDTTTENIQRVASDLAQPLIAERLERDGLSTTQAPYIFRDNLAFVAACLSRAVKPLRLRGLKKRAAEESANAVLAGARNGKVLAEFALANPTNHAARLNSIAASVDFFCFAAGKRASDAGESVGEGLTAMPHHRLGDRPPLRFRLAKKQSDRARHARWRLRDLPPGACVLSVAEPNKHRPGKEDRAEAARALTSSGPPRATERSTSRAFRDRRDHAPLVRFHKDSEVTKASIPCSACLTSIVTPAVLSSSAQVTQTVPVHSPTQGLVGVKFTRNVVLPIPGCSQVSFSTCTTCRNNPSISAPAAATTDAATSGTSLPTQHLLMEGGTLKVATTMDGPGLLPHAVRQLHGWAPAALLAEGKSKLKVIDKSRRLPRIFQL